MTSLEIGIIVTIGVIAFNLLIFALLPMVIKKTSEGLSKCDKPERR